MAKVESLQINLPGSGSRTFRRRDTRADLGVVAQMFEHQHYSFGRLRRRLDRLTEIQEGFLRLGCAVICLRFLGT